MVTVRNPTPKLSDDLYKAMQKVLDALYNVRDADDNDISGPFQELLPRRQWADYYRLIKHPQALNPVQNNVKRKTYAAFADFVKDCTHIFHNARIYNRHDSEIYKDAERLEALLRSELKAIQEEGAITEENATLPDLGPLPPPSPSVPSQATPDVDEDSPAEEEEEEEEDEEEEVDDDDDDGKKRRSTRRSGRGGTRSSRKDTAKDKDDLLDDGENQKIKDDPRRKRGRPPRVDTPMEIRVKNILKSLRKFKDEKSGQLRISAFEKLPEKKEFPEYFVEIKNPIALDIIRKNVKRREYKNIDQFISDMELMFENAKAFNEDDSQLYKDAVLLQGEMRKCAAAEKSKKDDELAGGEEQGTGRRLPLDKIEHKGEAYRVGDWIHIVNPNDPNKPTVAQIFRTWKDPGTSQIWINACWYYRPEQTVHWVEKKFYPDEVVKTGQYRDHHIDEVLGKCFVMFFTRYSRGRPKGIDENKTPIYVCESRYNEHEKHFNKIKTWKSCIPDEVRGQDYELEMFDKQRNVKKVPSPILHLLPANAQEDDPLPDAKMGVDNAPPILGAVFKRARRENDSPPPEPTPPPQPTPALPTPTPAPNRANSDYHETMSMTQMYKQAHQAASVPSSQPHHQMPPGALPTGQAMSPSPSVHYSGLRTPNMQYQYQQGPPPQLQRHPSSGSAGGMTPAIGGSYANHPAHLQTQQQIYNPPAPPTTFLLPESVTHNIPDEVKDKFMKDKDGKLLWFTMPPLDMDSANKGTVGHSAAWFAGRKDLEERRKKREVERSKENEAKRRKVEGERAQEKRKAERLLVKALRQMAGQTS